MFSVLGSGTAPVTASNVYRLTSPCNTRNGRFLPAYVYTTLEICHYRYDSRSAPTDFCSVLYIRRPLAWLLSLSTITQPSSRILEPSPPIAGSRLQALDFRNIWWHSVEVHVNARAWSMCPLLFSFFFFISQCHVEEALIKKCIMTVWHMLSSTWPRPHSSRPVALIWHYSRPLSRMWKRSMISSTRFQDRIPRG